MGRIIVIIALISTSARLPLTLIYTCFLYRPFKYDRDPRCQLRSGFFFFFFWRGRVVFGVSADLNFFGPLEFGSDMYKSLS